MSIVISIISVWFKIHTQGEFCFFFFFRHFNKTNTHYVYCRKSLFLRFYKVIIYLFKQFVGPLGACVSVCANVCTLFTVTECLWCFYCKTFFWSCRDVVRARKCYLFNNGCDPFFFFNFPSFFFLFEYIVWEWGKKRKERSH